MARRFKGAYVVIRDDLPRDKCTNKNNVWDRQGSRCLDVLVHWPRPAGEIKGSTAIETAWNSWGMNKFDTLRNAVDCWESNGGKVGKPESKLGTWVDAASSQCFFAMPVLKGNWTGEEFGMIWLAGNFVGQEDDLGRAWPAEKCSNYNKAQLRFNIHAKTFACAKFDEENHKGGKYW